MAKAIFLPTRPTNQNRPIVNIFNFCVFYPIWMKFGKVLRLMAIYLQIKFQASTVSATCIFYTKNAEITLFFVIASLIFIALT